MREMNIRMELRSRHLGLYPGSAEIEGLVLYPGDDTVPVVTVDKVTAKFDVTSLLGRRAEVRSLEHVVRAGVALSARLLRATLCRSSRP